MEPEGAGFKLAQLLCPSMIFIAANHNMKERKKGANVGNSPLQLSIVVNHRLWYFNFGKSVAIFRDFENSGKRASMGLVRHRGRPRSTGVWPTYGSHPGSTGCVADLTL